MKANEVGGLKEGAEARFTSISRKANGITDILMNTKDSASVNRNDQSRSLVSFVSSASSEGNYGPVPSGNSSVQNDSEQDDNSRGSNSNNDNNNNHCVEGTSQTNSEELDRVRRQREKRLAMNRASARERRKRKRLLIEELQEKSQKLTNANLQLRKANQELGCQVAQLTAILNATNPGLASLALSSSASAVGSVDSSVAGSLLTQGNTGLVALQQRQQERAKALLEASDVKKNVALAVGQASVPLIPTVSSLQQQAQLQQQAHQALLTQQLLTATMGLGGAAALNSQAALLERSGSLGSDITVAQQALDARSALTPGVAVGGRGIVDSGGSRELTALEVLLGSRKQPKSVPNAKNSPEQGVDAGK